MQSKVVINLFGSLPKIMGRKANHPIEIWLDGPARLPDVLSRSGVFVENIQLVMLNHKASRLSVMVRPGDRVALFPKEYPVFADWRDFRNQSSTSGVDRQTIYK